MSVCAWTSLEDAEAVGFPEWNLHDVTSSIPRRAYGAIEGLVRGLEPEPEIERVNGVLAEVNTKHRAGQVVSAADALLHYLVELIDERAMTALNVLLGGLRASLKDPRNADLYDDRGLARIHNTLALTLRDSERLPARAALRAEYRDVVARREGRAIADDAVRLL